MAPDAAPHEVRKTVTVVFADVAGSTGLGERLDPESVRRIMHRYFEEMRAAVERHDGTVEPSHEGLRTPRVDAIDQAGDMSPTLSRPRTPFPLEPARGVFGERGGGSHG